MVKPLILRKASYRGTVFDETTGKPVAGALVFLHWGTRRSYLPFEFHFWAPESTENTLIGESLSVTDSDGKYQAPENTIVRWVHWLTGSPSLQVLIYRNGYIAYRNDGNFNGHDYHLTYERRKSFPKTGSVVRLRPWNEDFEHWKHLEYINGDMSVMTPDFDGQMRKAWSWEDEFSVLETRRGSSARPDPRP